SMGRRPARKARMISTLILLALAASELAPKAPAWGPRAQEELRASIAIGQTIRAQLPIRMEGGRNAAHAEFELDLPKAGALTISLESLDFDPLLVVIDPRGG